MIRLNQIIKSEYEFKRLELYSSWKKKEISETKILDLLEQDKKMTAWEIIQFVNNKEVENKITIDWIEYNRSSNYGATYCNGYTDRTCDQLIEFVKIGKEPETEIGKHVISKFNILSKV